MRVAANEFFNLFVCATSPNAEGPMVDPLVPYTVILDNGRLSPAEDLETAIMAAAQSRASGRSVMRIDCGAEVVLVGEKLDDAIDRSRRTVFL
jgi:hypothetical protein